MKYTYKNDYTHIFDTPAKEQQEAVIAAKIMDLLNKNKYNNIYDFSNKNKTYQDFLKVNDLEVVVKHFGNTLTEQDFARIVNHIVQITENKKSFDKDNIRTTNIDNKQYVSFEGSDKTIFLDNSNSNMTIERQLEELQPTQAEFQTTDIKANTENMFKELEETKKESLNLVSLSEINVESLNDMNKKFFETAINYQLGYDKPIKVDLERQLIVDPENNIFKGEYNNGEFNIVNNEGQNLEKEEKKTFQKTLTPSKNTIYSDNE